MDGSELAHNDSAPQQPIEVSSRYDQDDPTTSITPEEAAFITSLAAEGDLTEDFTFPPHGLRDVSDHVRQEHFNQLHESHLLIAYSQDSQLLNDVGFWVAREFEGKSSVRSYIPKTDTQGADPVSLFEVLDSRPSTTEATLIVVFDNVSAPFSPLNSSAYVGPRANVLLSKLRDRHTRILVLSQLETAVHVLGRPFTSNLSQHFVRIEAAFSSDGATEPTLFSIPRNITRLSLFMHWCAAFFPDLALDDILRIGKAIVDATAMDSTTARDEKEKFRMEWTKVRADSGLSQTEDAHGIVRLQYSPPRSALMAQKHFREQERVDHVQFLEDFLNCGTLMNLNGRSLQIAAGSLATLARLDPMALGENLLTRTALASRTQPDIQQWWESDDFDNQPVLLLNLLQAEFVSLVRLDDSALAIKCVKALARLSPRLAIGLVNRCPPDYVRESWYIEVICGLLRQINNQRVRLRTYRRLLRVACHDGADALFALIAAVREKAESAMLAEFTSCVVDAGLLGQEFQRATILRLVSGKAYSEQLLKLCAESMTLPDLEQHVLGWCLDSQHGKVTLWIRQRLLNQAPQAQVFATAAPMLSTLIVGVGDNHSNVPAIGPIVALFLLDYIQTEPEEGAWLALPFLIGILGRNRRVLQATIAALRVLTMYFGECASMVETAVDVDDRNEWGAASRMRRYLNKQAEASVRLRKTLESEARV